VDDSGYALQTLQRPHSRSRSRFRGYRLNSRRQRWPARLRPEADRERGRQVWEVAISIAAGSLAYIDDFLPEDDALIEARRNAAEVGGAAPVSPLTGGVLRFLAAAIGARSVVEIGTGCGTSGIWLLRGMRPMAVLTTVDVEPEHQRLARAAYLNAGFTAGRYRLIGGLALDVLPRLADAAYDMVFCDADRQEYPDYLTGAVRLLRPGGIVVFHATMPGTVAGERMPTEAEMTALGELRERVRSSEELVPLLLPVGNGLLCAVRQPV
jgi:predicted O-methyltransferase YrrM